MAAAVDSFQFILTAVEEKCGVARDYLAVFGAVTAAYLTLRVSVQLVRGVKDHVISKMWPRNFVAEYGRWAVITGCTRGLGRCYAREFARRGLSVALVARRPDALKEFADEIRRDFPQVEVLEVLFDCGTNKKEDYTKLGHKLQDLDIGVVVNNAGVIDEEPTMFGVTKDEDVWNMVMVNCQAVVMITKLVLPGMESRRRGAIINLSSAASLYPVPYWAVYSASKSFVDYFTAAIAEEYSGSGVTIQCVQPSYVATDMTAWMLSRSNFLFNPTPEAYVSDSIKTLGWTRHTYGYFFHSISMVFMEFAGRRWGSWSLGTMHWFMKNKTK